MALAPWFPILLKSKVNYFFLIQRSRPIKDLFFTRAMPIASAPSFFISFWLRERYEIILLISIARAIALAPSSLILHPPIYN